MRTYSLKTKEDIAVVKESEAGTNICTLLTKTKDVLSHNFLAVESCILINSLLVQAKNFARCYKVIVPFLCNGVKIVVKHDSVLLELQQKYLNELKENNKSKLFKVN